MKKISEQHLTANRPCLLGIQIEVATLLAPLIGLNTECGWDNWTREEEETWSELYSRVEGLADDLVTEATGPDHLEDLRL